MALRLQIQSMRFHVASLSNTGTGGSLGETRAALLQIACQFTGSRLGYIVQIKRKSDGREVGLMSDTPALEKAAAQIAALPNGTEMDETFTPIQKEAKGKKGPKDGPIIVR